MTVTQSITDTLQGALAPTHLEVINESSGHNVPAGSETHFKVVVVSPVFEGESRIGRHRQINGLLADQLAGGVHALSIQAHTPDEWSARGQLVNASPECRGGNGR